MTLDSKYRFQIATFLTILSALLAGYFNVGSLYLFGLPVVPLVISLAVLWRTKASVFRKASVTLVTPFFIFAGFYIWAWWNEITIHRNW